MCLSNGSKHAIQPIVMILNSNNVGMIVPKWLSNSPKLAMDPYCYDEKKQ